MRAVWPLVSGVECVGNWGCGRGMTHVAADEQRDTERHDVGVLDLTRQPDAADAVTVENPVLDGDDITIVTDPVAPSHRRRTRAAIIAGAVGAVVIVAVVVALATHKSSGHRRVNVADAPTTAAPAAIGPAVSAVATTGTAASTPAGGVAAAPTTVGTNAGASGSAGSSSGAAPAPPPASAPSTTPTAPPASPVSVLAWSASPASLSITAGSSATITVTVRNPSDGVVTLPVPLSCAPTLDGSGVCPEMAQLVQPHAQFQQGYTVTANVAPGSYKLPIENGLFRVPVTVTPAA